MINSPEKPAPVEEGPEEGLLNKPTKKFGNQFVNRRPIKKDEAGNQPGNDSCDDSIYSVLLSIDRNLSSIRFWICVLCGFIFGCSIGIRCCLPW